MIISKITQTGLSLSTSCNKIPFQYSEGLEIEFIRDKNYEGYILAAFIKHEDDEIPVLMEISDSNNLVLEKDIFRKSGKISLSFSFAKDKEVIHLGVVEYFIKQSFGDDNCILPGDKQETWIELIGEVAKEKINNYWNSFYKQQLGDILNNISGKVSDASAYASQADNAKAEAVQSAANANSSASNASENANTTEKHLNSVIENVSRFNVNVENAENSINEKIAEAEKYALDASESADLAKKTVTNIYTRSEVDYMLADKMDKPYVAIKINDNTIIENTLNGNFKIDFIVGNCCQNIETDILPTSDRPVPITSKKIAVDGEVVELRSLKESVNLFDFGLLSKTELIPKAGAYRKIDIPLQLKPSTKYTFSYDSWEVPALSWPVLKIVNTDDTTLAGVFNYKNNTINAQVKDKINTTFTTDATGKIYFSYYVSEFNEDGSSISQSTSTFERLWFTKLLKNIMLVEGTTVPSSYVAATTRDYKIVDQVSKRSWIERNVIQKNLADLIPQKVEHTKFIATYVYTTRPEGKESSWNNIFCNNFAIYPYSGFPTDIKEGIHVSNYGIYVVLDDKRNVTTIEEYKEWIKDNPIIVNYQIATSFTEEIPYLENDQSEFGVSSQDSTSPSPNIKSEIETITKLNIKSHGKNFLNETLAKDYSNYVSLGNGYSKFIVSVKPGTKYVVSRRDTVGLGTNCYVWIKGVASFWMVHTTNENINANKGYITSTEDGTIEIIIATSNQEKLNQTWDVLGWLQVEEGDTATEYQPYEETAISHVLEEPLLKVGDKADTIDLVSLARKNNIYKEDLTTLTISSTDNNGMYNHINTTNRFYNLNVSSNAKASPTHQNVMSSILPYVQSVWLYDKTGITINYQQVHISLPNLLIGINSNNSSAEKTKKLDDYIKSLKETGNEYIYYALEKPTPEPLESGLVEKLKQLKAYGPVTHIFLYGTVKPTINGRYPKDLLLAQQTLETKLLTLQTEVIKNV